MCFFSKKNVSRYDRMMLYVKGFLFIKYFLLFMIKIFTKYCAYANKGCSGLVATPQEIILLYIFMRFLGDNLRAKIKIFKYSYQ